MVKLEGRSWIVAKQSTVRYFFNTPLYYKTPTGHIAIYKPIGKKIEKKKIANFKLPSQLLISLDDKDVAYREMQDAFSQDINNVIAQGDIKQIKNKIIETVEDLFSDPRAGSFIPARGVVSSVANEYVRNKYILDILDQMSKTDYSTAVHSINLMALAIRYAAHMDFNKKEMLELGTTALVHDIGKLELPERILRSRDKLSREEFEEMKRHCFSGAQMVKNTMISFAHDGILHHHEKLDGTGYPQQLKGPEISFHGKIIGIIDAYESLTTDDRLYRSAMPPYETLKYLKKEVDMGKYDFSIFANFARSLVKKNERKRSNWLTRKT